MDATSTRVVTPSDGNPDDAQTREDPQNKVTHEVKLSATTASATASAAAATVAATAAAAGTATPKNYRKVKMEKDASPAAADGVAAAVAVTASTNKQSKKRAKYNKSRGQDLPIWVFSPTADASASAAATETATPKNHQKVKMELQDTNQQPKKRAKCNNSGGQDSPILIIDESDGNDAMAEDTVSPSVANSNNIKPFVEAAIPPPTIFPEGKAQFPLTIDTGFGGHLKHQYKQYKQKKLPMLALTPTPLFRCTSDEALLPLIWPDETPTPCTGGGFYENCGGRIFRKTCSRVARLAGILTVSVRMANSNVVDLCLQDDYEGKNVFVLAEDLLALHSSCTGRGDSGLISSKSREKLFAIQNLNDRDNPFGERCLYVVAEKPRARLAPQHTMNMVAELKFYVYFRRTLFGLAANPNIKTLLDVLEPLPGMKPWIPCRKVPPSTNVFQRSQRPGKKGDQSLPAILWANESTGYPVEVESPNEPPKYQGAKVTLRDYQVQSVAWMRSQENRNGTDTDGGIAGLNGFFWERRTLADGDPFYYFPLGGQILLTPPPIVTGGMLAQEMGLGKTISALELICADVQEIPEGFGGTLVVVPVSLLAQWEEEIATKAPHLSCFSYHGSNVEDFLKKFRGRLETELSKYNVVLTTMNKLRELTSDRSNVQGQRNKSLSKIKWHRLIVDECQYLKNDTTAIARAASAITATHVWMLSGTPLTNKLDDLRGELSLLRVWPFTLGTSTDEGWRDHFWAEYIKKPWDSGDPQGLSIIQTLMEAVSMRHSRMQIRSDGSPLVELPPRDETFVAVTADSGSSSVFVNHWVEAAASKLLVQFNRFDVKLCSLVIKLRQLTTCPARLLDNASLEQMDDVLSEIASLSASRVSDECMEIKQVCLLDAIEEKQPKKDSAVLQELLLVASNGANALAPCIYCKQARSKPVYLECDHSLCIGCCKSLLAANGSFPCPVCSKPTHTGDIIEVLISEYLTNPSTASKGTEKPIEVDLDADKIKRVLLDQESRRPSSLSRRGSPSSSGAKYNVVYHKDLVDFQGSCSGRMSSFESLRGYPKPQLSPEGFLQAKKAIENIFNGNAMQDAVRHAAACKADTFAAPKIRALCDIVQGIRKDSLEAKICIFSGFSKVLDDVEEAFANVRYTVEYDMNTNLRLLSGQTVTFRNGERGHVVDSFVDEDSQTRFYKVENQSGRTVTMKRESLEVEPVVVENVPSQRVRWNPSDMKLSVNGSDDRYAIGSRVESKRPLVVAADLQVGYSVTILPEDPNDKEAQPESGRIVFVHRDDAAGEGASSVTFDVQPDGYVQVGDHGDHARKDVLQRLPPSRLLDKGNQRWLAAKILGVSTRRKLNEHGFIDRTGDSDPFEHAVGYVRLDGNAGDATRRGQILDTFKRDPMTSICLLTKAAAGVGLNLTDANYAIILEPSMDAHDEVQSIARIHRIGQTRKVTVLKLYLTGSVEERILKRRQQRGELNVSINAATGSATTGEDEEENASGKKTAEVSASRVMTFNDLKLLLGGRDD